MPLPERFPATDEAAARLRDALLFEERIEVHVYARRGRLWVRLATQIYNDDADVHRLVESLGRI